MLIFVGTPRRGEAAHAASTVAAIAASQLYPSVVGVASGSLLTHNFNNLLAAALNTPAATHFAMIHDDVCPDPFWADTLLEEMIDHDADLVSAVVPLKNRSGLTSTAVEGPDEWHPRPLSLREVFETERETFSRPTILLNTGLMLLRLDRLYDQFRSTEMGYDFVAPVFRQRDEIMIRPGGRFEAVMKPEDFDFTRQVRRAGGRVFATRRVGLYHGEKQYHNRSVWGDHEEKSRVP